MYSVADTSQPYTLETLDLDFSKKKQGSMSKCNKNSNTDRKNITLQPNLDNKT